MKISNKLTTMEDDVHPIDLLVDQAKEEAAEEAFFDEERGMWSDEEEMEDEEEDCILAIDRI